VLERRSEIQKFGLKFYKNYEKYLDENNWKTSGIRNFKEIIEKS
jgi:hypothetical protein